MFHKQAEGVSAELRVGAQDTDGIDWRIEIRLLDEKGNVLGRAQAVFSDDRSIIDGPYPDRDITLPLDGGPAAATATRFAAAIEVTKKQPPSPFP